MKVSQLSADYGPQASEWNVDIYGTVGSYAANAMRLSGTDVTQPRLCEQVFPVASYRTS